MGCCISKCKSKRKPNSNPNVQDKLVISQSPPPSPPPSPSPPRKRKTVQSPPSVTSTSFTCSTQSSTCGSSSLSSASSVAFSKVDRSFSNDFLQSCALENPQIIDLNPVKKIQEVKHLGHGSTQKRARAGSPNLTRQKSFRVEKERLSNNIVNGRTTMRSSPSPSRRFNGYTNNYQRQPMVFSMNTNNESKLTIKTNSRPASPYRNVINKERPVYLKKKETFGYEVGSKVEGIGVGEVLSKMDYSGPIAMEDLDNPHIALDCFIFL